MRITFVQPSPSMSGGDRVIADYASALRDRGHAVTLAFEPRAAPTVRDRVRKFRAWMSGARNAGPRSHFEGLGLPCVTVAGHGPISPADLPDADVLIANWFTRAEASRGLPGRCGRKVYLLQHDDRCINPAASQRIVATWKAEFELAAVSRWIADRVLEVTPDAKITVLRNGVDVDVFRAPPRGRQPQPTFGTMYSRAAFKGVANTFRAFSMARKARPDLKLNVMGTRQPTPDLPLPEGATFHLNPPRDAISGVYAACDFWLFGSLEEGFGLPVLEAMACRTPVIATRTGAAEELCSGGSGVPVQPGDVDGMAREILRCADLGDREWAAMSESAAATAAENSLGAAVDRLERFCETVAHPASIQCQGQLS